MADSNLSFTSEKHQETSDYHRNTDFHRQWAQTFCEKFCVSVAVNMFEKS